MECKGTDLNAHSARGIYNLQKLVSSKYTTEAQPSARRMQQHIEINGDARQAWQVAHGLTNMYRVFGVRHLGSGIHIIHSACQLLIMLLSSRDKGDMQ